MKSKIFLQLIILCFSASIAWAQPIKDKEAIQWVKDKGNNLLEIFAENDIKKKHSQLDKMFMEYVDMDYISKFVVGKYWKAMTEEQQSQFQALFRRYALAVYKNFPLDFDRRADFTVKEVDRTEKFTDVIVALSVQLGPDATQMVDVQLVFRLVKSGKNIKIIDLKLNESSLILSYRGRFYEMILKDDEEMEWFLDDFRDLTEKMELNVRKDEGR